MSAAAPQRLNVFVSSVYSELVNYRAAAMDVIWRCNLYPTGMDRLDIALPYSPVDSSRKMVDEANIYVGIFSQRYGVITAQEYQWAKDRGIPVLAFIADGALNDEDTEPNAEHAALLATLKQELRQKYVVATFRTMEQLREKVLESLTAWQRENLPAAPALPARPRGYVITADIPRPPKAYYAHPYFLGMQFFGRQAELAQLDAWALAPEPLLIIDAIGGAGKSALTWHWASASWHASTSYPHISAPGQTGHHIRTSMTWGEHAPC